MPARGPAALRRLAVAALAVALLAVGLAGPVRRTLDERDRAARAHALAEQVKQERAQAAARFQADRARILAAMRAHVERGEHVAALRIAAPFGGVDDAELRELFGEAARAESQRQRAAQYAEIVERDCTDTQARQQVARVLESLGDGDAPPQPPRSLVRVTGAPARAVVLARLREPGPAEHRHGSAAPPPSLDAVQRMRDAHRARLLPDYLGFLHGPQAEAVLCVWQAEGDRGGRRYRLDLWLAPRPDLRGVAPDVAAYREAG